MKIGLYVASRFTKGFLLQQEENEALKVSLVTEQRRRERAEGEAGVLQLAKQDLESRAQILEAQIDFYRNNPPIASLRVSPVAC